MSFLRCHWCEDFINTDFEPEAWVEQIKEWLCERCRSKKEEDLPVGDKTPDQRPTC
mgnify:FL=1